METSADNVFLIEGEFLDAMPVRPMREGLFGKTLEDALQTLIEKYPEVIPGSMIEPGSVDPPRFVLLRREMPTGGWSLDHLLVDQRGVLTLVETKLIQNQDSRRDVLGQIMEYAAVASGSWSGEKVREIATEFWAGRYEESMQCQDQALSIDAQFIDAWHGKSVCLLEMGCFQDAVDCLDTAIQAEPEYPDLWFSRGDALAKLGRTTDALSSYDRGLEISDEDPGAWVGKGCCLLELGDQEAARNCFRHALSIDPRTL